MPRVWGDSGMADREANPRNFLAAFNGHWFDLMSGGASVPFAIAAVFVEQTYQKVLLAGAAILCFVLAAYRIWATERKARNAAEDRVKQLESEYARALHLAAINVAEKRQTSQDSNTEVVSREIQFVLQLENKIARPIEYEFRRLSVDGTVTPLTGKGAISANATTMYYTALRPGAVPIPAHESHVLELEYVYGEPGRPTRTAHKTIDLNLVPSAGRTAWTYSMDEDSPCP